MQISVFMDHILQAVSQTKKPLEDLLKQVKESGIDGIEANLTYLCKNKKVLKLLSDVGLKVSCIYEFYEMGIRDEKRKYKKHIKMAKKVGAGRILVVPGFLTEDEAKQALSYKDDYEKLKAFYDKNAAVRRMMEGVTKAVKYGQKHGVTVTFEDFDLNTSPVCNMNGLKYFFDYVPDLKFTLDMGNFAYIGEDVLAAWDVLKDHVAHVHCKDRGEGLSSVATGGGYLPIKELIEKLKETGYDGYLAIEHFDMENQEEAIKDSATFLRECIR